MPYTLIGSFVAEYA